MRPNSSFVLNSTTFPLRESLVRLNLCSERDFRRCRRHVRRLARGIPAFDFVWVDALLHAGVLTPFQAKVLETSPPEVLRLGPCVLLDRMGRGEFSETYLARTPGGFDHVVLKRLRLPAEEIGPAFDRLRALIERLRGLDNPFAIGPHFVDPDGSDLIVLSRHAAGPNFRELLIRRGRYPVDVVGPIARQLASGLAALESRACLHGQIQLPNVRLTASGQAVLVDAGIGQSLERGLILRGDVPPETYEGTAPELIGTGKAKTTATEIYAFGCLIWQLLAGRPPFPTGDPLGKLAAHQSRAVPDIREFAPDTPPPLAEAVQSINATGPQPATRELCRGLESIWRRRVCRTPKTGPVPAGIRDGGAARKGRCRAREACSGGGRLDRPSHPGRSRLVAIRVRHVESPALAPHGNLVFTVAKFATRGWQSCVGEPCSGPKASGVTRVAAAAETRCRRHRFA